MRDAGMNGSPESTGSKQDTRWRKGQSGNPMGRPRGAKNRATMAAESLLEGQSEALTQICIDRALRGDPMALRLCLDRIIAPRRDRHIHLSVPTIHKASDVPLALIAILEATTMGTLTPEEGQRLSHLVEQIRKGIETAELEQRIEALEQQVSEK